MLLVPARTDTKQFHNLLDLGLKVKFIKGRLKYNDKKSAPFPSIIMYSHILPILKELEKEIEK